MKKIPVLFIIGLFVAGSCFAQQLSYLGSTEECKKLSESTMREIFGGNIPKAFALVKPYFPIPESEFATLQMQTIQQLGMIGQRFGAAVGYEFFEMEEVKNTFMQFIYVEKFERHFIRWIFVFYKPKNKWLLNSFRFDDEIKFFFNK